MSSRKTVIPKTVAPRLRGLAAALLLIAGNAAAAPLLPVAPSPEAIDACVQKILEHAGLRDAVRIKHWIEIEPRRSIGHKLNISTQLFPEDPDGGTRAYSTVCTVTPKKAPLRFEIREVARATR